MSAELAARRTAAQAVVADFKADLIGVKHRGTYWADRLAYHLESLLEQIDTEAPDPAPGFLMAAQLAAIQLVLEQVMGDEYADRQYALEEIDDILRGGDHQ